MGFCVLAASSLAAAKVPYHAIFSFTSACANEANASKAMTASLSIFIFSIVLGFDELPAISGNAPTKANRK